MIHTGLRYRPPFQTDWIARVGETPNKILFKPYLPTPKKQYADSLFDTMSCVTFSALNILSTYLNYMISANLMSSDALRFLRDNGYIDENEKVAFSDRFTAIVSGTTIKGNYLTAVGNAMHTVGLLPDQDLPFGGTTWYEYMNPVVITPAMYAKAKMFKQYFTVNYLWLAYMPIVFDKNSVAMLTNALNETPIQVSIFRGTHAEEMYDIKPNDEYYLFDSYPPFDEENAWNEQIDAALKITITERVPHILSIGCKGQEVYQLQQALSRQKFYVAKLDDVFGVKTRAAVIALQRYYHLQPDGIVGSATRAFL